MSRDRLCWAALLRASSGVLLIASAAPLAAAGEAPVRIGKQNGKTYLFQKDVEAQLKGGGKERERAAVLLPLRILLAHSANPTSPGYVSTVDGGEGLGNYLCDMLKYVESNNVLEAIPFLERALRKDIPLYGRHRERSALARVWIKLKTKDMAPTDKAKFLVKVLSPGNMLMAEVEATKELTALGKTGRPVLIDMLVGTRTGMKKDDARTAASVAHLLHQPGFQLSKEEVERILRNDNGYAKVVMCIYLAREGDKRSLQLIKDIWRRFRADHPSDACWTTVGTRTITRIDGFAPVALSLCKKLDSEGNSAEVAGVRRRLLVDIFWSAKDKADSVQMREYLNSYLKRPLPKPVTLAPEEFVLLREELLCRKWAKRVLDKWSGAKS